jgi:chromate transporter
LDEQGQGETLIAATYTLRQFTLYARGLGTWGFGGPVALIGYM